MTSDVSVCDASGPGDSPGPRGDGVGQGGKTRASHGSCGPGDAPRQRATAAPLLRAVTFACAAPLVVGVLYVVSYLGVSNFGTYSTTSGPYTSSGAARIFPTATLRRFYQPLVSLESRLRGEDITGLPPD